MQWTIAVGLVTLWLLGLVTGYTLGHFIHVVFLFAIIAMLMQMEDDCRDYGSGRGSRKPDDGLSTTKGSK